ncbi:MAG: hypothetical protein A2Z99_05125 [Treponema sp. GWB1_62_6]|nr:MAG: hypothetical protein A2Z99_05125 [Treponema sp. GWB1_62_6]OHE63766.1 MAG: hypothetical protein A2001_00945 [Treponema sp. GWC1_61_84]OHE64136.1 MAG: hypothetical protein A2Y36_15575 [Treponema sp. GWA1_62_8]OHE68695.1 MAG: hypothetical protein A2413_09385 [Treponema sp. RIFOXYC1_FULL_61_9]HCM27992.1 hypothetical protein [Treponema sp.]
MKKLIMILLAATFVSVAAFADHPKGMGVGLVAGGNFGSGGAATDIGLSLKLPSMPIFWAARLSLNADYFGLGVTGDKYMIDKMLFKEGSFKLDWYAGLGGYANLGFGNSDANASLGARLPIGLSWHITREFELWLGIAPSLGLSLLPEFNFPDWFIPGELGLRIWLK